VLEDGEEGTAIDPEAPPIEPAAAAAVPASTVR